MKTIRIFGMVLMTVLLSVSFAACDGDYKLSNITNNDTKINSDLDSCKITLSNFIGVDEDGNTCEISSVELLSNGTLIERKPVVNNSVSFVIDNAKMQAGKQNITAKYIAENGTYLEESVYNYTIYETLQGTYTLTIYPPAFVRELCDVYLIKWYKGGTQEKTQIDMSNDVFTTSVDFSIATYNTIPYNILIYIQPKSNIEEILASSKTNYIEDYFVFHDKMTLTDSDGMSHGSGMTDEDDPGQALFLSSGDFANKDVAVSTINSYRNFILFICKDKVEEKQRKWCSETNLFSSENYIK